MDNVKIRIIRMPEVTDKTGLSRPKIYEMMAAGQFPRAKKLLPGGRAIGFLETAVDDWISERFQEVKEERR